MLASSKDQGKDIHRSSAAADPVPAPYPVTYAPRKSKWLPWTLMPTDVPSAGNEPTSPGTPIERIDWHPEMLRLMVNIVPDVRSSFSAAQMYALAHALRPVIRRHALEYRVSLPFFGGRFYVAFFAGRERRTRTRLAASGQLDLKVRLIAVAIISCVAVGAIAIGTAAWRTMALAVQLLDTLL